MSAAPAYETLLDALRVAASSFRDRSGRVVAEWDDPLGRAVSARLNEAMQHGDALTADVAEQADAHRRLGELGELVEEHARVVREQTDVSSGAVRSAREALDRAADLAAEARAAASASGNAVDQALRVAATAGAECGRAVSFGDLEGMLQQQVVRARKAEVAGMAAKAAAHEVVGHVVEEAVQNALGVPEGAIPDQLINELGGSVRDAGEITVARVRGLIKRLPGRE